MKQQSILKMGLIAVALPLFILMTALQEPKADAILGTWKEKDGNKTIYIYKIKSEYFGKIKENLSTKENRLEPGMVIMKNFIYDDDEWRGTVEIPTKDLSLKGKIEMLGPNEIKSTATIAFFGKSKTWLRVK
ncbi:hypothetical protein BCY91_14945 [Pelobium manganitolerans]|uniref:DUF2147 domain-containing protein n=1 Tax=Pelobium manganitolerans TaxID=1842495 RepID=A0A419S9F7_9SPHI|nr:DUF2147 domain-containing protein [Pelobium manganitolerans]RKD18631.1 hypothetical protein BCY91_14945 [Pelobium manganitolerans]